jgi:hypothetical protein
MGIGARLVDWAIYAVIALAVLGGICKAWDSSVGDHYREQQQAKDAPLIAALTADRNTALAANKVLAGDVDELRARFNALFAEGNARTKASDAAIAAANLRIKNADAALAAERATLARPKSTEPCTGVCAAAYDELGKLIADDLP